MFKKIITAFLSHPAWTGVGVLLTLFYGSIQFIHSNAEDNDINIMQSPPAGFNGIWIEPITKTEFVWIPGGCFQMGKSREEQSEIKEEVGENNYWLYSYGSEVRHKVCLDGFWMSKYEVTQGAWEKVMDTSYVPSEDYNGSPMSFNELKKLIIRGGNYPVADIYFSNAQEFIDKLNSINNGKSLVSGKLFK